MMFFSDFDSATSILSLKSSFESSLRSDAERFVREISVAPEGTGILADTLLRKAWDDAVSNAKSCGRRPRQNEVQALMQSYKDRCSHGLTL